MRWLANVYFNFWHLFAGCKCAGFPPERKGFGIRTFISIRKYEGKLFVICEGCLRQIGWVLHSLSLPRAVKICSTNIQRLNKIRVVAKVPKENNDFWYVYVRICSLTVNLQRTLVVHAAILR